MPPTIMPTEADAAATRPDSIITAEICSGSPIGDPFFSAAGIHAWHKDFLSSSP